MITTLFQHYFNIISTLLQHNFNIISTSLSQSMTHPNGHTGINLLFNGLSKEVLLAWLKNDCFSFGPLTYSFCTHFGSSAKRKIYRICVETRSRSKMKEIKHLEERFQG